MQIFTKIVMNVMFLEAILLSCLCNTNMAGMKSFDMEATLAQLNLGFCNFVW